jgi:hypothetical protein
MEPVLTALVIGMLTLGGIVAFASSLDAILSRCHETDDDI